MLKLTKNLHFLLFYSEELGVKLIYLTKKVIFNENWRNALGMDLFIGQDDLENFISAIEQSR